METKTSHKKKTQHKSSDYRVKAGALQFTMYIVVVIALLLATFTILVHTQNVFKQQTNQTIETINNANNGMHYALLNTLKLNDTILVNLPDQTNQSLKVHCNYWGLLEKVTVVSNKTNKTFKKIALIGAKPMGSNRTALYMEDHNRPLVLVGNTKIQGTAYLPKQGVRTGNISGHAYYGSQLIYGQTRTSSALPKLEDQVLKQIKHIPEYYRTLEPDQFIELKAQSRYANSFKKPLEIIYKKDPINLSGVSLTGHIIIQSATKINVDATANLKDVVLVAPTIELKSNVKGRFQAIATKAITVGAHSYLEYPSALVLKEEPILIETHSLKTIETPLIHLKKGAKLKGSIVYLGTTKNYDPQVLVEENATVTGEIYSNKNIELLGSVHGSVYTSGFVASQSGSVYQNHIYNGTIATNKLVAEYVGLVFENSKKGISKWLY